MLTIFDLERGIELSRWHPEPGWASIYDFAADGTHVVLSYRDGASARYSLTGDFLDRPSWLEGGVRNGNPRIIELVLNEAPRPLSPDLAGRLIEGADMAFKNGLPDDKRTRAWALKLKAMCFDAIDDRASALAYYEKATDLDPACGAKRRSSQLRKALGRE